MKKHWIISSFEEFIEEIYFNFEEVKERYKELKKQGIEDLIVTEYTPVEEE